MDHIRVLRRALSITLNYRVLWVFGILLALTTGSGGGNGGGGNGAMPAIPETPGRIPSIPNIPSGPQILSAIAGIAIGIVCLILILAIVFTILRLISEVALIRLANDYEATGEKVSVGTGFRLGWSRATWRMFLMELLFGVGTAIIALLLLAIALAPLLMLATNNRVMGTLGVVATVGLVILVVIFIILLAAAVSLLTEFFRRAIVLENQGVFDGIRRGWEVVRRRPGDAIIMLLILFALGLGWAIVMIPVFILLLLVAGAVGGLPGLAAWFLAQQLNFAAPWVAGLVVGLPIILIILILPLLFLGGLVQVFKSTTWTLTYREMTALEAGALAAPAPAGPLPEQPLPGPELAEI